MNGLKSMKIVSLKYIYFGTHTHVCGCMLLCFSDNMDSYKTLNSKKVCEVIKTQRILIHFLLMNKIIVTI